MNGHPLEFRVRQPPLWSTRFALSMGGGLFLGWVIASGVPLLWQKLLVMLAVGGLLIAAFVAKVLSYRKPPAPIRVFEDAVELPRSLGSFRTRRIPLRDLTTLELRGGGDRTWLLVGAKGQTLVIPAPALEQPEQLGNLHAALFERIAHLPVSNEVLETMRRGREATRALVEMRPRVTHLILLSLAVAYGIQILTADESDPLGMVTLIRLGANVDSLIWAGQIDRLVTANFLHAPMGGSFGILHIGFNALAIWMLGGLMERLLGHARYFVIYALSAVGGALASTLGNLGTVSMGASTAVLGLFGALAIVHIRHLRNIPPAVRQPTRWWIIIIGINAALGLAVPGIDHWGHGGGLVTGMVATLLLTWRWPPLDRAPRKERLARPVAWLLAGVTAVGLGVSGYRAAFGGAPDLAPLAEAALREEDPTAEELNYYAWMIAIHPQASRRDLEAAQRAAQQAHELDRDAMEIVDTLAQAHWRLGEVDRAIELERQALTGEPVGTDLRHTFATQLARFLEERVEREGPIVIGDGAPELSFEVKRGRLHTTMHGEPPPTGMVAYVVVERGDPLPWLLRVRIGPDATPPAEHVLNERWPNRMSAHVALVDSTVEVPRGVDFRVEEYEPDDGIAGLP